jgi:hypothetical protein
MRDDLEQFCRHRDQIGHRRKQARRHDQPRIAVKGIGERTAQQGAQLVKVGEGKLINVFPAQRMRLLHDADGTVSNRR